MSIRRQQRSASITLEAILSVPILVIATVALVQFFITATVKQAVTSAAEEGARVAAMAGSDMDDVHAEVNRVLGSVNLAIGNRVTVIRQTRSSTSRRGTFSCQPPTSPGLAVDEVRVTLCVDMTANPMLNSLMAFGIDTSGRSMRASALRYRE